MASSTLYEGWGRSTWSDGSFGTPILKVSVDGVSATGAVGSVSVIAEANVFPTGLEATGGVGSVTVVAEANVPVTGLEATGSVGSVSVVAEANVFPTGVEATGEVGTAAVVGGATVEVTGVSADALTPTGGSAFTADGNAQLSTAQAKFGSASLLLDGTDDFVTSDDNIDLSSGDFTVDMWIRPTNVTGYKGLWQSGTSSLLNVYLIGDQVQGTVAGSTTLFLSSTRISANVWTMISVEREGNVHRLYINGVLEQSSSTANRPDDGVFSIGKNGFGDFNGYIDETRVSTVARYSGSSFTEPTTAFLLDTDTTALLHFDGANGSTTITNAASNVINFTLTGTANVTLVGVEGVGEVNDVEDQPTEILDGVSATGAINGVTTHVLEVLEDAPATGTIGEPTITAVVFDFQAVREQYSRRRTVLIPRAA